MVKLLIKKQLREIFRSWFVNQKTNQRRSKAGVIGFLLLFVVLMVGVLGGIFTVLSFSLAGPLSAAGVGWLHFSIMTLIAILLGVFGSVFNTYSGLYLAKDNDLLLSLPIPSRALILSRLLSVYLMGLMYSACVTVPAVVVWWIVEGPTAANVVGGLLLIFLVSAFVLLLSCLLGWVVAKVSLRLKHKSFTVVILSLVFIGLYYFVYFKAQELIQQLIANAVVYGNAVQRSAYPVYLTGRVGEGDWLAMLIVTAVIAVLTFITWRILSRSFLGIATSTGASGPKRVYRERAVRVQRPSRALLQKELRRFTSNANYMLNCGLSMLFMPIAAVALLWKGREFAEVLGGVLPAQPGVIAALLCSAICMVASMNDMAAPAVSLEGKSLWLLQSLPVPAWEALKAKLRLQLVLTAPLAVLCGVCAAIALRTSLLETALLVVVPLLYCVLLAALALLIGTVRADLHWTNEIAPIKQSMAVFVVLLLGWLFAIIPGGGWLLLGGKMPLAAFLALLVVLFGGLAALAIAWLRTRGAKRFETLS